MTELSKQKCIACSGDTPTASEDELAEALAELDPTWKVVDDKVLRRQWAFKTFRGAFTRATAVALLAEQEGHHPDLEVGWGRLQVDLTTHAIGGLSRNDLIMAAKIDKLDGPQIRGG